MKKYLLLYGLLAFGLRTAAQGLAGTGLLRQAQLKNLARQSALLHSRDVLKDKGYDLAEAELALIGGNCSGLLRLHRIYYGSLRRVTPALPPERAAGPSPETLDYLAACYRICMKLLPPGESWLTSYVIRVFSALRGASIGDLQMLACYTREGTLAMENGTRMHHVLALRRRLHDRTDFAARFTGAVILISGGQSRIKPQP